MTTQQRKPTNLYEFLDLIREKPHMYLGEKSISRLHQFILGYIIACWVHNEEQTLQPAWNDFDDFISKRFNDISTSGWARKILDKCNGDEEIALKMFYELFDSFRNKIH